MTELEKMKEINSQLSMALGFVVIGLNMILELPEKEWESELKGLRDKAHAIVSEISPPEVH